MKKNVGLVNYRVSFKCKFNKYVYEAKKCWTCKLQSKFYMQTTTYYVHETTNTQFTFENCGGCLKQIRKKNVRLLEPLKYNFNEQ